jgi:hypothetical protein
MTQVQSLDGFNNDGAIRKNLMQLNGYHNNHLEEGKLLYLAGTYCTVILRLLQEMGAVYGETHTYGFTKGAV